MKWRTAVEAICWRGSNWMFSLDKQKCHTLLHKCGNCLLNWGNNVYFLLVILYSTTNVAPQTGKPQIYLMSVQLGFTLLSVLVISESPSMHGLPCSSLGQCFGNPSDVNTDPAPAQEPNNSRRSRNNNNHGPPAADPVVSQPEALCRPQEQQHKQPQRTVSCISDHSTRSIKVNGTNSICHLQDTDEDPCFESPPACRSLSQSSEDEELEMEFSPELELKYPQIPRPSIIIRRPEVRRLWSVSSVSADVFNNNQYSKSAWH